VSLFAFAPRRLVRQLPGGRRPVEDQRGQALRTRRREEARERPAVPGREEGGPLEAGGVADRGDVAEEVLDRRRVGGREALRAAQAAPVGHDDAPHARELAQEARERRLLPVQLDVREISLEVEQIWRAVAEGLVGKRDLTVPGVPRVLH
jgi:hypothetical protein